MTKIRKDFNHLKRKGGFYLLKCNFHTHFFESYGNNAKIMVDAYHDAGYDCIALTEHFCFLENHKEGLNVEKEARAYAEKKYNQEFLVVIGEEMCIEISKVPIKCSSDIIGLFLDEYVFCGRIVKKDSGSVDFVSAGNPFDDVHVQGGIVIAAHDHWTVWSESAGKGKQTWAWDFRKNLPIDGWEVGNGFAYQNSPSGLNLMLSHPQESVSEGYMVMANSDAHSVNDIKPYGVCCTYLFVTEKTTEGIKEALLKKRSVADCNGKLYGEQKWLNLLRDRIDPAGL